MHIVCQSHIRWRVLRLIQNLSSTISYFKGIAIDVSGISEEESGTSFVLVRTFGSIVYNWFQNGLNSEFHSGYSIWKSCSSLSRNVQLQLWSSTLVSIRANGNLTSKTQITLSGKYDEIEWRGLENLIQREKEIKNITLCVSAMKSCKAWK